MADHAKQGSTREALLKAGDVVTPEMVGWRAAMSVMLSMPPESTRLTDLCRRLKQIEEKLDRLLAAGSVLPIPSATGDGG